MQREIDELQNMQQFLEIESYSDANELVERLGIINSYMARAGVIYALLKKEQEKERRERFESLAPEWLKAPVSLTRQFIESDTCEINYFVTFAERILKTCSKQSDNVRTMVSFEKQQLDLQRRGY